MGALLYNIEFFFLFNLQVEEPLTSRKTYPEIIEKQVSSLLPGHNRKITFGFLLCLVSVSWSKAVSCCSLSTFCFVSFSTFSAPDFSSFSFAVIALLACIKNVRWLHPQWRNVHWRFDSFNTPCSVQNGDKFCYFSTVIIGPRCLVSR